MVIRLTEQLAGRTRYAMGMTVQLLGVVVEMIDF